MWQSMNKKLPSTSTGSIGDVQKRKTINHLGFLTLGNKIWRTVQKSVVLMKI